MSDILSGKFGHGVAWKGIEHLAGKTLLVVQLLVLARILLPDDFGLIAIASVAVGILSTITDLGLIQALIQKANPGINHYHCAWTFNVCRGLFVMIFIIAFAPFIAALFTEPRVADILRVLSIRLLFESFVSIKTVDLNRKLKFRSLAYIKLSGIIIEFIVTLSTASFLGVWAFVAGNVLGTAVSAVMSYRLAPYLPQLILNMDIVKSLIQYGRWIFLSGLNAVIGSFVIQLVISRQLGTVDLGLYYLGAKLAFLPSEIASVVVGGVSFPLFSRLQSKLHKLSLAFQSILIGMAAFLLPIYFLLIALAPTLANDILGPEWEGTVPIIRILAVVGAIGIFGDVSVPAFKGTGHPYKATVLEFIQSLLIICFIWGLTDKFGLAGAAAAWVPAIISSQLACIILIHKLLTFNWRIMIKSIAAIIMSSISATTSAIIINDLIQGMTAFVATILFSVGVYYVMLLMLNRLLKLNYPLTLSQIQGTKITDYGH